MAADNYDAVLAKTLSYEGGFSNDAADPGGATKYGITHFDYAEYLGRPVSLQDVRDMPLAHAKDIYRKKYWAKVRGDKLPAGPDLVGFDGEVNSGSRGLKWLAQGAGTTATDADKIADAVNAAPDKLAVIKLAVAKRGSFLQGLKTFKVFGPGWMKRVHDVEATATKMWLLVSGKAPAEVQKHLQTEAKRSEQKVDQHKQAGTGTVGTAGTGSVAAASTGHHWVAIVVGVVVVGTIAFCLWQAYRHSHRAQAFAAAAQGVSNVPA